MADALYTLAKWGAASWPAFWLPVLAWTGLALAVEAALRLRRPAARLGLRVRGALLALLPALLVAPPVLARWVPSVWLSPSASAGPPPAPGAVALPINAAARDALLTAAPPEPSVVDVTLGLAAVLAGGVGLVALSALVGGLWWLSRYRRTLRPAPASLYETARDLAGHVGVRREVAVVLAEPASSPFTVGWRRPVVAVPPDLDGEPLRLVLGHELAHVRGGHYGWTLAERVVRAVFVWHPLVHVLGRGLALGREQVADAVVLRLWPDRARRYGQLLHAFSARPSPALALGASSSPLLLRLDAMTRPPPDRPRAARLAGALVLVVPLVLAAAAAPDARDATGRSADSSASFVQVAPPAPEPEPAVPAPDPPVPPPAPDVTPAPAASDSLAQHIESVEVRRSDESSRIDITLRPGTSRETALAIADMMSRDDASEDARPVQVTVLGSGAPIVRSARRVFSDPGSQSSVTVEGAGGRSAREIDDAPPAPVPLLSARSDSRTRAFLRGETPPGSTDPESSAVTDLERYVDLLQAELVAVEEQIDEVRIDANALNSEPEDRARYLRLTTRRDAIADQFRIAVRTLEARRLEALRSSSGGAD